MVQPLPNLDALRFIAASLVIFGHVNHALFFNGHLKYPSSLPIFNFASYAVVLFFVLSGFLITYLLLKEKEKREISVKNFYLKRVLRIWPVYFLIVILAFAYFNRSPFFYWHQITDIVDAANHPVFSTILLLFISPNILLLFSRGLGYANPAWSIGVEEQFYLIWPWIMKSKNPMFFILAIIFCLHLLSNGVIMRIVAYTHLSQTSIAYFLISKLSLFFTSEFSFKIDAMAIGAVGAFCAQRNFSFLSTIFKKPFQYVLYVLAIMIFLFPSVVSYQFYSIIFILIILNLSINPKTIFNLNNPVLRYLGKISYGLYMYHCFTLMPTIYLVLNVFKLKSNLYSELLICILALIFTIIISSLSYKFLELYFLRLKEKI